jgi:hypothetical protein
LSDRSSDNNQSAQESAAAGVTRADNQAGAVAPRTAID